VTGKMVCVCLTAKADFLIYYEDGRREIVELKGHVLKRGAWSASAEHARKYILTVLNYVCEEIPASAVSLQDHLHAVPRTNPLQVFPYRYLEL
jgi:hypothetical protein